MNKQQKSALIESLRERLAASQASFIVEYKGLTVNQMQVLRRSLKSKGAELQVAKGRLIKRAATGLDDGDRFSEQLNNQIGVVFASDEASAIAKVLNEFAKDHQALVVRVGRFESKTVDASQIKRLANLPSREVLLAQLCYTLNAPITQFTRVLQTNLTRFAYVLEQVVEQKRDQQ